MELFTPSPMLTIVVETKPGKAASLHIARVMQQLFWHLVYFCAKVVSDLDKLERRSLKKNT